MSRHTLDLLENAVDSLDEALRKFREGENGDAKAYKFAVLHMSQFIELIFKHHLLQLHPLLIYKNPFAPKLDKTKTITFWDSINFISNETGEIDPKSDFRKDLEWLKRLRNDIEHYKFEMDVTKVRETLGRTFRSVLEFIEHFSEVEIEDNISKDASDMFQVLSDEYEHKLHDAIKEADDAEKDAYIGVSPKEYTHVQWVRYDCPECGNHTMIPNGESSTGIKCTFCENEDTRERLVSCDCCGADIEEDEMDEWPMDDGSIEHRCYYCSGRYYAEKDD
jgi:uncharacterized protein YutE (UPF0331/DUF86 family)